MHILGANRWVCVRPIHILSLVIWPIALTVCVCVCVGVWNLALAVFHIPSAFNSAPISKLSIWESASSFGFKVTKQHFGWIPKEERVRWHNSLKRLKRKEIKAANFCWPRQTNHFYIFFRCGINCGTNLHWKMLVRQDSVGGNYDDFQFWVYGNLWESECVALRAFNECEIYCLASSLPGLQVLLFQHLLLLCVVQII